jgi:hypothetical protein
MNHSSNVFLHSTSLKKLIEDGRRFEIDPADHLNAEIILSYYNERHPGLNADYVTAHELTARFEYTRYPKEMHKRFVVKLTGAGHSVAATLFRDARGRESVILLDPTSGPSAVQMEQSVSRRLPNTETRKRLFLFSTIQKSAGDCFFSSLMFLKQMRKNERLFADLHRRLFEAKQTLPMGAGHHISSRDTDSILPPGFYRNAHARTDTANYFAAPAQTGARTRTDEGSLMARQTRLLSGFKATTRRDWGENVKHLYYSKSVGPECRNIIRRLLVWEAANPHLFD